MGVLASKARLSCVRFAGKARLEPLSKTPSRKMMGVKSSTYMHQKAALCQSMGFGMTHTASRMACRTVGVKV